MERTLEMTEKALVELLHASLATALEAGKTIRLCYDKAIEIEYKADGSPLTEADESAHAIIAGHLAHTGLPIISEEGKMIAYNERQLWDWHWLVDPLDGTREFISRNGEFTVNIALIHKGSPVLGVIAAPVLRTAYLGLAGVNAWKITDTTPLEKNTELLLKQDIFSFARPMVMMPRQQAMSVAVSRSHYDEQTRALVRQLIARYDQVSLLSKGSSLKFCDLAENLANIYPRYSITNEWDTGAGHAILKAAGGEVYSLEDRKPLRYNKESLQNPPFIAIPDRNDSDRYFSELSL
jgi:3'(2'), 5'-bisphosphate nucleotidase